jgi:metal-sulfur cluster biosynthetic enzyme
MTMTSAACPVAGLLIEEVREVLRARFPDVSSIDIELVWDPPWSPDRMSPDGRRQLGWS